MKKIIIIGAGPAGAVAAKILAGAGHPVTLFDHRAPWEKPCGGILGPEAPISLLEMDTFDFPVNTCDGLHYHSLREQKKFIKTPAPFPVVSRKHLSSHMLDQATDAGADFKSEKVLSLSEKDNCWQVTTDAGSCDGDIIIGADGVTGISRKFLSRPFDKKNLNQSCGYFMTGIPKEICLMKFLDIHGYLWIVSSAEHTSAGILAKFGTIKGKELFTKLDTFLEENFPEAHKIDRYAALIPAYEESELFNEPCCGKNWLLVGDAAGHTDPVLGEGIHYALESGRLAAEAILSENIKSYDTLWQRAYGDILKKAADYHKNLSETAAVFGNEYAGAMLYNYFTSGAQ